ncbi:MAG TPA: Tad domain-containing protein [Verrucomicrobiae bacterium]|nr:Tad domain-containing protein [Verrucomicrobiae bacterium]
MPVIRPHASGQRGISPGRRQRGVVLLFFTFGLLAVIGMVGFSLDIGRGYLNRTRVQNAADAAALEGALILAKTGSTIAANAAATAALGDNLTGATGTVEFSDTQSPFVSGGLNPKFVRVIVDGFQVNTTLSRVLGVGNSFTVSGTAVAGPLAQADPCGVPLGVCGNPGSGDTNCSDGSCYGLSGSLTLKDAATGPGNYGLMDMGQEPGGISKAMAGGSTYCAKTGESKATEPGAKTNTTANGLNSRFGNGKGAYADQAQYPPDSITTGPLTYPVYETLLASGLYSGGVPRRREVVVPVINCTGVKGKVTVPVMGTACLFLTQPVPTSGPNIGTVYAEIVRDGCLTAPTSNGTGSGSAFAIKLFANS